MPQTSAGVDLPIMYLCSKTQLYTPIVSRVAATYVAVVKSDSDIAKIYACICIELTVLHSDFG